MTTTTSPTPQTPAERARHFVAHEGAFRLGVLPTEQPHPGTRGLAETAQHDPAEAVRLIQRVDRDLLDVADRVFHTEAFAKLTASLTRAVRDNRSVFFTGCGATGRLSILLEACWRKACQEHGRADLEDRVFSVMAGGDFALIKSVEGYEDFTDFGRHQIDQTGPRGRPGVNPGDVVVAITEGGETSFVIGTAWRGLERGADTFFVFNNPADVLAEHVVRSRAVVEEPRITKLDLSNAPMAVAGSTRMQATTIELLVVGAALEMAFDASGGGKPKPAAHYRARYAAVLDELEGKNAIQGIAGLAAYEAGLYREGRLVTYFADQLLLDILTDTTERSPTFSLPPFRQRGDEAAPPSWSFVQNPAIDTEAAWRRLLGRDIRGIAWNAGEYAEMGAPRAIADAPPALDAATILTFPIGAETLPARAKGAGVVLLGPGDKIADDAVRAAQGYAERAALVIDAPPPAGFDRVFAVPVQTMRSPLELDLHLTAKLALNTLSTVSMAMLGRMVSNWMVHVSCTNKKLIDRGTRLIADQAHMDYDEACVALHVAMAELAADPALAARTSPVAHVIAKHPPVPSKV